MLGIKKNEWISAFLSIIYLPIETPTILMRHLNGKSISVNLLHKS